MTKGFKIARELELPVETMTETVAILAQKGFGKTYGAMKLAEEMMKAGGQIVALDPVGKWWSLRLSGDGRKKWSDIPVFGGLYGDFSLSPDKGAFLADVVIDHHTSAVLDVSTMSEAEKKRFVADFAARLKHRKSREPDSVVHLFIEEAQEFIPQRPQPDDAKMLGALVRIAKLGRNWGIGLTMISQRPQAVSKEALNLASLLLVGCMIAKHDRKAIEEWVEEQGKDDLADSYLSKLPKLQKGEMIAWSPSWLDLLDTIHIAKKETFDSSATPKLGAKLTKHKPKPIDADALRVAMTETEEKAKADDPRELRRRIQELEKQVKTAAVDPGLVTKVRELEWVIDKSYRPALQTCRTEFLEIAKTAERAAEHALMRLPIESPVQDLFRSNPAQRKPSPPKAKPAPATGATRLIGKSKLMLQHLVSQPDGYTKEQLAILVGMSSTAGGFNNYLGQLRSSGCIETRDGRLVSTPEGLAALGGETLSGPTTTGELVEMWLKAPRITGKAKDILRLLVERHPRGLSKEELAEAVGMSASAGGFNNYLGVLRSANLITKHGADLVASEMLFP